MLTLAGPVPGLSPALGNPLDGCQPTLWLPRH